MIRLDEDDSTDAMIEWLRDTARIADPTDAANLRVCADRMQVMAEIVEAAENPKPAGPSS